MPTTAPAGEIGWKAPAFTLTGTDGDRYHSGSLAGPNGLLVAFICNHCPYVVAVIDRIARDARDLAQHGIGTVAICSNDPVAYPDDSFENMVRFAERHALPFPYLHDPEQRIARAFGAACTPDFFGLNTAGELQYRGRIDAAGRNAPVPGLRRDLFEAMREIAETGRGPAEQIASIGCSIKWAAQ